MRLPDTATVARRHQAIRRSLDSRNLDALIVTTPANIRYLTSHVGSAGTLVVTAEALHLIVDFRYEESVRALQASAAACPTLRTWPVPASYDEALITTLATIGAATVGVEAGHLTVARHEWLLNALSARATGIALRPTERLVERLRLVKDAFEVAALRGSAARLAAVGAEALQAARPGRTEREVAGDIEAALRRAGYERPAFDTIVASGPNSALPHARPTARRLAPADGVVLDFGGVYDGYCVDLTRTLSIAPVSADFRRLFDAVRDAQRAAIAAVRRGALTSAIDAAARTTLEQHGLGEAFSHGTGHGLGLEVHEGPRISPTAPAVPLETGMVVTIEPGAYVAGQGGVRIEDDVLVTDGGCELLTDVPIEL